MLRNKGIKKIKEIQTDFNPGRFDSNKLTNIYGHGIKTGKDVFFRLKNNEHICWRRILIGMYKIAKTKFFVFLTAEETGSMEGVINYGYKSFI